MDYRAQAWGMITSGLVPVPLRNDSTKLPKIEWKKFQNQFPTREEVNKHFKDCGGIAAITLPGQDRDNLISNLFLIDFDLKNEQSHQDFFKAFGEQLPVEIKRKFLINTSASGVGRHVWFKTEGYWDKSRKLSYRLKTPEELVEEKIELLRSGENEIMVNHNLLRNPYKVVIETRGSNSYGVFIHKDYKRVYGKKLQTLTKEETQLVVDAAYSTSDFFEKKEKLTGDIKQLKVVERYNEDVGASEVLSLLEQTGGFKYVDTMRDGSIRFLRHGSKANCSGKIFGDTAVVNVFSSNTSLGEARAYSPFEIYCIVNNYSKYEGIKKLINK